MPRRPGLSRHVLPLALAVLGPVLAVRAEDAAKPKVAIDADHEALLAVLKKLCSSQGMNYVIDAAATDRAGTVSLHLAEVSFEDALSSLCDTFGLEARIQGTIVVVRVRPGHGDFVPARSGSGEKTAEKPAANRFLPERESPGTPPVARETQVPSKETPAPAPFASTAEVTTRSRYAPNPATSGGGAMAVGLVVEIGDESIKLKENAGDPREYWVASGPDDANRTNLQIQALKRLKKGDKVALEYRVDGSGQARIMNLLGGGRP